MQEKINSIHENHVRAGIARKDSDFVYSWTGNYEDFSSVLNVTIIRPDVQSDGWKSGKWMRGKAKTGGWHSGY